MKAPSPRAWAILMALCGTPCVSLAEPAQHAPADTAPTAQELSELEHKLESPERATRQEAFDALRTLGADALPAIRARLKALAGSFDATALLTPMSEFRRVQGVDAPNGPVDLQKGILEVLERDHSRAAATSAELVLLLRALEAQKSPEAADVIVGQLFALDSKLFRYELPRTRERLGALIIAALIRYQTHPRSWIRTFCHNSLIEMRVDKPGRAVQQDDVALLAAILDAYGDTLNFEAMPVVVSYLTDERVEVREAAGRAIRRYGKNAIWQIRERYANATGKEADPNWGWERTLDELYRLHAAPKKQAFEAGLQHAQRALDAGDVQLAKQELDKALADDPHNAELTRAAPLYARIAASFLEDDELERALASYRRALRLDPSASDSANLRARVLYLEAELRLGQGVVDLEAYRRASELDPSFQPAREALDELSGERAARDRFWQRLIGSLAAALMALAAFSLLKNARNKEALATPAPAPDEQPEA